MPLIHPKPLQVLQLLFQCPNPPRQSLRLTLDRRHPLLRHLLLRHPTRQLRFSRNLRCHQPRHQRLQQTKLTSQSLNFPSSLRLLPSHLLQSLLHPFQTSAHLFLQLPLRFNLRRQSRPILLQPRPFRLQFFQNLAQPFDRTLQLITTLPILLQSCPQRHLLRLHLHQHLIQISHLLLHLLTPLLRHLPPLGQSHIQRALRPPNLTRHLHRLLQLRFRTRQSLHLLQQQPLPLSQTLELLLPRFQSLHHRLLALQKSRRLGQLRRLGRKHRLQFRQTRLRLGRLRRQLILHRRMTLLGLFQRRLHRLQLLPLPPQIGLHLRRRFARHLLPRFPSRHLRFPIR